MQVFAEGMAGLIRMRGPTSDLYWVSDPDFCGEGVVLIYEGFVALIFHGVPDMQKLRSWFLHWDQHLPTLMLELMPAFAVDFRAN